MSAQRSNRQPLIDGTPRCLENSRRRRSRLGPSPRSRRPISLRSRTTSDRRMVSTRQRHTGLAKNFVGSLVWPSTTIACDDASARGFAQLVPTSPRCSALVAIKRPMMQADWSSRSSTACSFRCCSTCSRGRRRSQGRPAGQAARQRPQSRPERARRAGRSRGEDLLEGVEVSSVRVSRSWPMDYQIRDTHRAVAASDLGEAVDRPQPAIQRWPCDYESS